MTRPPVGSTGTLAELQVEPGDVVEYMPLEASLEKSNFGGYLGGRVFYPPCFYVVNDNKSIEFDNYITPHTPPSPDGSSVRFFRLISRANPDQPAHIITHEGRDSVNHPPHYNDHPSGIECIQITEHMGFCLGNAVKYLWRADLKGDAVTDLRKAIWYIEREIAKREPDA